MTTSIGGTTGVTFPDASVQTTAATGFGFKNRIINGAMMIDQRNAGAQITSAGNGAWAVDRWVCYHDITTVNIGQNLNSLTPPAGFTKYLGFQVTSPATATSGQYTNFQHYIEGFNAADLAWGTASAQAVTISFWVRSSITGTQGFALLNADNSLGYAFTVTINSADTWEYKTVTIAGPTSGTWNTTNGRGIALIVDLGNGSGIRASAGSWIAANVQGATGANSLNQTNGATFYITGVQLEKGSTATSFDYRPYGTELALCQRYYGTSGAVSTPNLHGGAYNGSFYIGQAFYPVTMRTTPTITSLGGTGSIGTVGVTGFYFSRTSQECYITGYTASAEL